MTALLPGSVVPIHDNRQFEQLLLAGLPVWSPGSAPVQLVVSSESLRRHWVRRVCQAKGATLGIEVLTHTQFIRQILEAGDRPWRNRPAWIDHRIRALAADQPNLRGALGGLDDGYALVSGAVTELFDAGFQAVHADAILEAIQGWPSAPGLKVLSRVSPRIADIIRVAEALDQELEDGLPGSLAMAIDAAVDILARQGADVVPSSQLVFLGFCDATGRITDFLDAARRYAGGVITIEVPVSPTRPDERDPGVVFAQPYHARFEGLMSPPMGEPRGLVSPQWVSAADPFAEAAAVGQQIADDLKRGVRPEDIGVVVRSMEGWATPIRLGFRGAAVPFSGVGATGIGASEQRRISALVATLRAGPDASGSMWISASGRASDANAALALDQCGVRTLLELDERLKPVGHRLTAAAGLGLVDGTPVGLRAELSAAEAVSIRRGAQAYLDAFEKWPVRATAAEHWPALRDCLERGLCVEASDPVCDIIDLLEGQFPADTRLDREEVIRMFTADLSMMEGAPIGGEGGGVAVLDATEARGRTFARLYIMGMNRGRFPRAVSEDPLLPDAVRRGLRPFLPDLRQKSIGVAEERFLFAQLLAAAPQVMLSCSEQDARGKDIHPSSLLVELQLEGVIGDPGPVQVSHRPHWEVGVERGLHGGKVADALGIGGASGALMQLTASRHDALPAFSGEVGPVKLDADPRNRDVFVTAIEAIARCPWNAFLTRYLGIRERPDPLGPLPSVSVHLLGRVVHMVVERVVAAAVGEEPRDGAAEAVPMTWPSASTLEEWILDASRTCLQADGVAWRGFALAVVNPAKAAIGVLKGLDVGLEGVWAAEAEFRVQTSGGHSVGFKADRLDVVDGRSTITDFKLGRAPTDHKKPETRAAKVLKAVRSGRLLQGALYARALDNAVGRYLYLHPDHELPVREFVFSGDDPEIQSSMDEVIGEVCGVIATGAFFPRVSEAGEDRIPVACKYCAVREACVVGDSAMRKGVMALSAAGPDSPTSTARRALWWRGLDQSS
jgi:hypothetical protein